MPVQILRLCESSSWVGGLSSHASSTVLNGSSSTGLSNGLSNGQAENGPLSGGMSKKALNLAAHACWKLGRWQDMEGAWIPKKGLYK